jgi:hypothetical protein
MSQDFHFLNNLVLNYWKPKMYKNILVWLLNTVFIGIELTWIPGDGFGATGKRYIERDFSKDLIGKSVVLCWILEGCYTHTQETLKLLWGLVEVVRVVIIICTTCFKFQYCVTSPTECAYRFHLGSQNKHQLFL